MDIHQLRTFVTVAREGSITRSAELLHLSQPAVSAHIKAMEELLGLTLFERTASMIFVMPPRLPGWLLQSPPPSVLNGSAP